MLEDLVQKLTFTSRMALKHRVTQTKMSVRLDKNMSVGRLKIPYYRLPEGYFRHGSPSLQCAS